MSSYSLVSARRLPIMIVGAGLLSAALVLSSSSQADAATALNLDGASSFAVLAATTVTNTGPSQIAGDIGVSPGNAVTGFPPGTQLSGAAYIADAVALDARNDATAAFTDGMSQTPVIPSIPAELGGRTLTADLYTSDVGFFQINGVLTLDGSATDVFIFRSTSTLVTGSSSSVVLNGVSPCNVFWIVQSSVTLGSGSAVSGNLIAGISISTATGADVDGSLIALNGAVTLDDTDVFNSCVAPIVNPGTGITIEQASTNTAAAVAAAAAAAAAAAEAALLAATGTESNILLGVGAAVLLGGATLVLVARRRNRAATQGAIS